MNVIINILFLGGAKRVSIADVFIRTALTLGKKVNIFSYELSNYEPIADVGTIIKGMKWTDPGILADLENVIRKNEINIVVPFVDVATILCAKLQKQLPQVHFCVSDEYISDVMFDKKKSHDWFSNNNFLIPSNQVGPPLIAKLIKGSGAKGMKYLYNQSNIDFFLKDEDPEHYFFQEIIEGEEFSVDCFVDKGGRIISIVPRRRLEVINGEATRSKTVRDMEVITQSTSILKAGGFRGPVTIQFIRQISTGQLYLIEINPRPGSGILTSIKAGANICKFILYDYLGIHNQVVLNWKDNLLMVRAFKEYYFDAAADN